MASVNRVILLGNVGKDPEIRTLQSGGKVASFSLATTEVWKDKATGQRREKTEWHNVAVFNEHLVPVVEQYARKGSKLYVEGSLETRKWTDKSGSDRYTTEVVVKGFKGQIVLLDGRNAQAEGDSPKAKTAADDFDDSIPF